MKRTRFSISQLALLVAFAAVVAALMVRDWNWSRKMDMVDARLAETETMLNEVAMPRYPNARVVITKPDGRQGSGPLLHVNAGQVEKHDRRVMNHWNGPDDWGNASSGGYFWRYIGSEGDRDIYEFIVVFGKRLPAMPDETTDSAFVRYVSFRGTTLDVVSQHKFSITLVP